MCARHHAALQMPSLKGTKSSKKRQVHQLLEITAGWLKREGERSCPVEEVVKSVKEEMAFDFNLEEWEGL